MAIAVAKLIVCKVKGCKKYIVQCHHEQPKEKKDVA